MMEVPRQVVVSFTPKPSIIHPSERSISVKPPRSLQPYRRSLTFLCLENTLTLVESVLGMSPTSSVDLLHTARLIGVSMSWPLPRIRSRGHVAPRVRDAPSANNQLGFQLHEIQHLFLHPFINPMPITTVRMPCIFFLRISLTFL